MAAKSGEVVTLGGVTDSVVDANFRVAEGAAAEGFVISKVVAEHAVGAVSGKVVTSCGVADSVGISLEAPSKGASDAVTAPVGDPALVANREVEKGRLFLELG